MLLPASLGLIDAPEDRILIPQGSCVFSHLGSEIALRSSIVFDSRIFANSLCFVAFLARAWRASVWCEKPLIDENVCARSSTIVVIILVDLVYLLLASAIRFILTAGIVLRFTRRSAVPRSWKPHFFWLGLHLQPKTTVSEGVCMMLIIDSCWRSG